MPSLSIIVSAYNSEESLSDCIVSILASTCKDYEIILVDDGSTDSTGEICDKFQSEHEAIRVFHTENHGLPSARNFGIEQAAGQFIAFADADDLIAPELYKTMLSVMQPDTEMAVCRYRRCDRSDAEAEKIPPSVVHTVVGQKEAAELIYIKGYGPYVWNKLYRKDILDRYQIRFKPETQCAEDIYFNAMYLRLCRQVVFVDHPMYFYINNPGSITNIFRENRTVSEAYMNLPRSWRFVEETLDGLSEELTIWSTARAAMFYQTVLRKLQNPQEACITEVREYVKRHKSALLRYRWGVKFYISALVLCSGYPLWKWIFCRFD